ncbi:TPA: hypothetical protein NKU35_003997 [Vibrio parahaemolyticus]|nr:hypothetical protein [Vibrio parahaemolyticus]HCH3386247.1 hypothetical protein [Vibrio parahaemolyticus]HCH5494925.1 hypothetical protein [Vibrio parahaemolyticus]HCH5889238.1 hypothetical protein [Vibrio parahaemolyticus]HCH6276300.1 hypothetical protein [Vibrio parahaemolyticus]
MKYILTILLTMVSSSVFAGDWYQVSSDAMTWRSVSKNKENVSMQVSREDGLSVLIETDKCQYKNQERELGQSMNIMTKMDDGNRIPIRFDFYCQDKGVLAYVVQMKDYNMLLDMFRVANVVYIGEVEISAVGFSGALKQMSDAILK